MVNLFDVAKYFLEKSEKLSGLKLQKLCYYAQAWSLVWDDKPLFIEDFEAWATGPVYPKLFNLIQGRTRLSYNDISGDSSKLSAAQIKILDKVLNYYGDKDDIWLYLLTTKERPWKKARKGVPPGSKCHNVITKESMKSYYQSL